MKHTAFLPFYFRAYALHLVERCGWVMKMEPSTRWCGLYGVIQNDPNLSAVLSNCPETLSFLLPLLLLLLPTPLSATYRIGLQRYRALELGRAACLLSPLRRSRMARDIGIGIAHVNIAFRTADDKINTFQRTPISWGDTKQTNCD